MIKKLSHIAVLTMCADVTQKSILSKWKMILTDVDFTLSRAPYQTHSILSHNSFNLQHTIDDSSSKIQMLMRAERPPRFLSIFSTIFYFKSSSSIHPSIHPISWIICWIFPHYFVKKKNNSHKFRIWKFKLCSTKMLNDKNFLYQKKKLYFLYFNARAQRSDFRAF